MLERVVHVTTPVRYWKNRIITLLIDSSTASGLPNSFHKVLFYTFESAEQLHARKRQNTFRCVQGIVRKIQLWIHRIVNGRISAFLTLSICRRGWHWFGLHSSNHSWAPYHIFPRWIDIALLTITSKHLTGCEALLRCQSCRFIVKWIALLNSRLSCQVDSCGVWLNFEWMSRQRNQIFLICVGRKQKLFFQQYTVVKRFFNDITIFSFLNSTRGQHQVCVDEHNPLFRQTCETNSKTRLSLKFVNVGDEPNLLKLVFVSFS